MACLGPCSKFSKDRCGILKNCLTKCCDDFNTPKPEPVQAPAENHLKPKLVRAQTMNYQKPTNVIYNMNTTTIN